MTIVFSTRLGIMNIMHLPICYDDQAVVFIAESLIFHKRTDHIKIECHFINHKVLI